MNFNDCWLKLGCLGGLALLVAACTPTPAPRPQPQITPIPTNTEAAEYPAPATNTPVPGETEQPTEAAYPAPEEAVTDQEAYPAPEEEADAPLLIASSAFEEGGDIPVKYTCDGDDVSPPLAWSGIPEGAQSLALIVDDPDAPGGTWVHWVLFNIPAEQEGLPEGVQPGDVGVYGVTDFQERAYGGPCPPSGTRHRYFFRLYALDTTLDLEAGASRQAVDQAMEGHILAEAQLMGMYGR